MARNFRYILAVLLALVVMEATFAQSTGTEICQPGADRIKKNLEAYSISDLHFVGILDHDGNRWAILTAPDQKVYRAKVGNYLGIEAGCLRDIKQEKLVIEGAMSNSGKARRWELPIEN